MITRRHVLTGGLSAAALSGSPHLALAVPGDHQGMVQQRVKLRQVATVEVVDGAGVLIQRLTFSLVAAAQRRAVKPLQQATSRVLLTSYYDARAASVTVDHVSGRGRRFNYNGYIVRGGRRGVFVPIAAQYRAQVRVDVVLIERRSDGTATRYRGSGYAGAWIYLRVEAEIVDVT